MADVMNAQRWAALKQSIIEARQAMSTDKASIAMSRRVGDKAWSQVDDLIEMADRLVTFADGGMKWLNKTAAALEKAGATRVLNQYPPQYACNLLVQQAIHDFRIIWHVHLQRRDNVNNIHQAIPLLAKLAQDAFQPAIKAGMLAQPSRTIVYLQKTSSIRILPYARVALIGLPSWLSKLNPSTRSSEILLNDLHAVAHEVGHHVYWHGMADDGHGQQHSIARLIKRYVLNKYTGANEEIMKKWSEEIFADVYSFLYAGPSSIASLFELISDHHWRRQMYETHDDHPAPLIRPMSVIAALEASGQTAQAAALRAAWHDRPIVKSLYNSDLTKDVRALEDEIKALAIYIFGLFKQDDAPGSSFAYSRNIAAVPTAVGETAMAQRASMLADMLRGWRRDVAKLIRTDMDAATDIGPIIGWAAWIEQLRAEYRALGLTSIDEGDDTRLRWVVAQSAGGWTEGPANGGNRP